MRIFAFKFIVAGLLSAGTVASAVQSTNDSGVRIMFASEQSGGTLALHSMKPDGSDLRMHVPTAVRGRGEYEPAVSPNGTHIAFTTYRYGGWKLAIADIDGKNVRRLTPDPQYVYDPAWSPDGKTIAYRRIVNGNGPYFRGNGAIFAISNDGSNNRQLTHQSDEHVRNPAFSPDGGYIVYDAFVKDGIGIMKVDADGSGHKRLTPESIFAFSPSFSPDGQWIAHLRQDKDGYVDVWTMDTHGNHSRNITNSRAANIHAVGDAFQHWQLETSVSPDGHLIAFTADYHDKGNADIYVVSIDDGSIKRLTHDKGADLHPVWFRENAD